jgi:hypothetical protein
MEGVLFCFTVVNALYDYCKEKYLFITYISTIKNGWES